MTTTPQDQRDNPVAHHVSDEVRAWLGRKRRTQSDLARHMGIAKSAVSVRLNGSREFSISELVEIAAWLDISLADLLGPELLQARRSPRSDRVAAGAGEKEWTQWNAAGTGDHGSSGWFPRGIKASAGMPTPRARPTTR